MDGGSSAPPIGAAGGAAGGGAAGGGGGGLTFPASFAQRQTAPPPIGGGFGRPDESAMVDSLVSQFSEINTAFDPEATLRRFVEVTNLPVEQARGLLTSARPTSLAHRIFRACSAATCPLRALVVPPGRRLTHAAFVIFCTAAAHGGDLRAAIAAFVASQARSTATSSFEADLDDSDSDDDDSDDEPKIRPVYRTQSGRGIRMRAADRACATTPDPAPRARLRLFTTSARAHFVLAAQCGAAETRGRGEQRYLEGPATRPTCGGAQDSSGGELRPFPISCPPSE